MADCECGCGGEVRSPDSRGRVRRFLSSHNTRMPRKRRRKAWEDYPPPIRDEATGCLRWQGPHDPAGYGRIGKRKAHNVAHERAHGPIPDGWVVDHVRAWGCVYWDCVELRHLQAVPTLVNSARAGAISGPRHGATLSSRDTCDNGHEFTDANTRWSGNTRHCRACGRDRVRRHRANR